MPAQESPAAEAGRDAGAAGGIGEQVEDARGAGPPPATVDADPEDPDARSPRVQMAAAAVTVLLLVGVAFHLLFVFLHVAPESQASRKYQEQTREWIFPVFEQNWHLFAPDPLNTNTRVNARVQYRSADGTVTTSEWIDLTGDDVAHIRGNPFPSKADQNLLRRAWEFYSNALNGDGSRTPLAEDYLRRIVVKRLQADGRADGIVAVQLRAVQTPIGAPDAVPPAPNTREFGWWETNPDDFR